MRQEAFKTISVLDPALDTESLTKKELYSFVTTRDFAIVDGKWVPGMKPTIFHVHEVPHGLWEQYVMSGTSSDQERCLRAFIAGVSKVENLVGEDGVALTAWQPAEQRGKHILMTDAESARFSPAEREEIGSVIFNHSFLPRRMPLFSPLPYSVDVHSARRACRRAEPSQITAPAKNSDAPSASTEPTPSATEIISESNAAG